MHFTRARELIFVALLGFVLIFFLFRQAYGSLPPLPLALGLLFVVFAIFEIGLGFSVRSRIRSGRVLAAISISRAVALAKASSILAALLVGAWIAALVYLIPRSATVTAASKDLLTAWVGSGSALALTGAALWLEHCCRNPDWRDRRSDRSASGY